MRYKVVEPLLGDYVSGHGHQDISVVLEAC
jgi:hypothetical protein